jgi:hypothetical protein
MTKLRKIVQRETEAVFRGKPIIIQLEPPNIIKVKEKGRRIWYETTTESVFYLAARQYVAKKIQERKDRRKGCQLKRVT